MFKNNLKLAIRNLLKHRLFSLIKLSGFTIGLTACLLIGLYFIHETSYDKFHANADRIARVIMEYGFSGEVEKNIEVTGNKVGPSFEKDFPEIEKSVRVIRFKQVVQFDDKLFEEDNFYFADSSIFDVFTIPLLKGNTREALNEPYEVVLSTKMAEKYFGSTDPVGQEITIHGDRKAKISGIFESFPATSQLQPDFIGSFMTLPDSRPERSTWWSANYATYVLVHPEANLATINKKIPDYMAKHANETGADAQSYLTFTLEPLLGVHLHSKAPGNFVPNGDIRYLYILAAIGILILLIASTTYVNLTTATSTERSKEIGVQKVLGAEKRQVFRQHINESVTLTGGALIVSYALVAPLLPLFNNLIDRDLSWSPLFQPLTVVGALLFVLVVGFLSGLYPALVLSNLKIANVIKGRIVTSSSGNLLKNTLVVFQFGITVLLLICTGVLNKQMNFIQSKNLGYQKDQIVVLQTDRQIINNLTAIKTELTQNRNVESISLAYETPVQIDGGYNISKSSSDANGKPVRAIPVDEDFIQTLEIEMLAGRPLSRNDVDMERRRETGEDTTSVLSILLNESQALALGWTAEEAVGQYVQFNQRAQIQGVFKDFHFESLHEPIGNLVIFPSTWGRNLLVKIGDQDIASTLLFLKDKWTTLVPHRPFVYHFMDEEFNELYDSEIRTAKLVSNFSLIAILLAFLGLFGLASYSIVQRTKEIGIRKVLGASVLGIVTDLSKDFIKLVVIALVIAAPLSWYLMNNWLDNFTYHVDMGWLVFGISGLLVITIALLAVGFQSMKAALTNPIESLRME